MKVYRTLYYDRRRGENRYAFARTQADAKATYKQLVEAHDEHNVDKPEQIEFPTTHQGVVDWLNLHAQRRNDE